jgi:hypothetical protein
MNYDLLLLVGRAPKNPGCTTPGRVIDGGLILLKLSQPPLGVSPPGVCVGCMCDFSLFNAIHHGWDRAGRPASPRDYGDGIVVNAVNVWDSQG